MCIHIYRCQNTYKKRFKKQLTIGGCSLWKGGNTFIYFLHIFISIYMIFKLYI